MTPEHYPPDTTAADLDRTAWDAAGVLSEPTWADLERYRPELASAIDEQFIAESADQGDMNDLLTAVQTRRMAALIRIGDRIVRDRAGFRRRRMPGVVLERDRDDG